MKNLSKFTFLASIILSLTLFSNGSCNRDNKTIETCNYEELPNKYQTESTWVISEINEFLLNKQQTIHLAIIVDDPRTSDNETLINPNIYYFIYTESDDFDQYGNLYNCSGDIIAEDIYSDNIAIIANSPYLTSSNNYSYHL